MDQKLSTRQRSGFAERSCYTPYRQSRCRPECVAMPPRASAALAGAHACWSRSRHGRGGPDPVELREGDLTLKGMLFRPDGKGPFPAVVAMHNCAGLVQFFRSASPPATATGPSTSSRPDSSSFFQTATARAGLAINAPTATSRPRRPRAGHRCDRRAALAPAAARGEAGSDFAAGMVQRRHRRVVDGPPPFRTRRPHRFPLRRGVLSGLPPARNHRLERPRAHADPDRRARRLVLGAGMRADGGRRQGPQRAGVDRRLSRRAPRFRPSVPAAADQRRLRASPPTAPAASIPAPIRPRAPMPRSACAQWLGR